MGERRWGGGQDMACSIHFLQFECKFLREFVSYVERKCVVVRSNEYTEVGG